MMNLYKLLFSSSLILGSVITMSSYSWVGMWMGLEINLLSIIPLMTSSKNMMSSESALKYFITQTIASSVLLFSLTLTSMKSESMIPSTSLLNMALLLKMGAAPLHFWFPEVMEGLTWMSSLIVMTWQKLAPLSMMMYMPHNMNLLYSTIIISITVGGIMGINQTSMRKILAFSSINHVGWMMTALMFNSSTWMVYFLIYSTISANLIFILKNYNLFTVSQMFSQKNNILKTSFLINLLSMGGVPPFLGFFPKWLVLMAISKENPTLSVLMVVLTLITLFMYLRTIMPWFSLNTSETKLFNEPKLKFSMWFSNWSNIMALTLCTVWFNLN